MKIDRPEAPDFILESRGVRFALEATTSNPSTSGAWCTMERAWQTSTCQIANGEFAAPPQLNAQPLCRQKQRRAAMRNTDRLAQSVVEARGELGVALEDKRRWPQEQFRRLFSAVTAYADATADDKMIHRDVAACMRGLREYLEIQRKCLPGDALFDADRLETVIFSGYDPSFDGAEPPGL